MQFPTLERLSRIGGWVAIAAAVVVSLVPAGARPHSGFPDELEHFAAYLCVAALLSFGYRGRVSPGVVIVLLGLAAIALELAQSLVPGRQAGLLDAIASTCGAVAGALLVRGYFWAGRIKQ